MRHLKKWRNKTARHPGDAAAWQERGAAAMELGQREEAVEAWRRSFILLQERADSSADSAGRYIAHGTAFDQLGLPQEALRAFKAAYDVDSNSTETLGFFGLALARSGRVAEGVDKLRRACELCPRVAYARIILADWLVALNELDEAIDQLRIAQQLDPAQDHVLVKLGKCLRIKGRHTEALSQLRLAHKRNPTDLDARVELALALTANGERREAIALLSTLASPATSEALTRIGAALREIGEQSTAIRYLQRAIQLAPHAENAHRELGVTLVQCGLIDAGTGALRQAADLAPESAAVQHALGLALQRAGDTKGAVVAVSRAAALEPGNAEIASDLDKLLEGDTRQEAFPQSSLTGPVHPVLRISSAFTGELASFSMPDLLDFLKVNRRTGTLLVTSNGNIGEVKLHQGKISGASAPGSKRIGEILVALGALTQARLREAMTRHQSIMNDDRLGKALLDLGWVEQDVLLQALSRQSHQALAEMVQWVHGSFSFEPAHGDSADQPEPCVTLDVDAVLLDVMRQLDELRREGA
jgi:tetratricopeptide (TPR) repeat protein